MRERMWACAILPDKDATVIQETCQRLNRGIGLPETVFRFPLHISLKKSWMCESFEDEQKDAALYLKSRGSFEIGFGQPILRKNMIWLPVNVTERLEAIHDGLDELFECKYGVPRTSLDRAFEPHVSLFAEGNDRDMSAMHALLVKELSLMTVRIRKVVIGGAVHQDYYYDLI